MLVFALAQGMFWAGVAATFVMGLGTAITVAAIATLAVTATTFAAQASPATRTGYGMLALRGIEVAASIVVLAFGVALLAGYMASERLHRRVSHAPTRRCCIAGGGPAGMMLGFLLARAGIDVTVLEKHADFLRDFRGDTIHPSTLEVMHELGLLDEFLKLPHQKAHTLGGAFGREQFTFVDFSHLPTRCKFIALMPQWDFLNFLADHGKQFPNFHLRMQTEATDLIEEGGRVAGVRATAPDGEIDIRADLVVGGDGRHSILRERAGLQVEDLGAPMDVLWFRLPHQRERSGPVDGPLRGRAHLRADRPRRLLAMRLRDPERHDRGCAPRRARGVPRRPRAKHADVRGSCRRVEGLGPDQAAHRRGRSAARPGTGRDCSASAMPRMRCRRSAASA